MKAPVVLVALAVALTGGFALGRALPIWEASASPEGQGPPEAASEVERAALADGEVTRGEYDAAFSNFATCLQAAGFSFVEGPTLTRFETYYFVLARPGGTAGDAQAGMADRERCQREHFDALQFAWARQHQPTANDRTEARRLTASCLNSDGVDVSNDPSQEELIEALGLDGGRPSEESMRCLKATSEALNWPGCLP